jgi:hypothetical protein
MTNPGNPHGAGIAATPPWPAEGRPTPDPRLGVLDAISLVVAEGDSRPGLRRGTLEGREPPVRDRPTGLGAERSPYGASEQRLPSSSRLDSEVVLERGQRAASA